MPRVLRIVYAVSFVLALTVAFANPKPAEGDGPSPTFAPELTPAPSPTAVATALPLPISRPEDARGIQQTMAPYPLPSAFTTPVPPPSLWLSTTDSSSVPCSLHGDRLFVPVVVNGRAATFLLDSAALFSSIDPSSAPSHDAPIKLGTVQVGAVRFNGLVAGVGNIRASSRSALGEAADGVLGQELFARYPVLIDYAGCSITVFRDGATARAALASGSHQIALHLVHGLPVVDARFDDLNPTRLLLDTASDGEVDVNREYASTSIATFTSAGAAARRWSPGGWISGERVRTRSLSLGDVTFDRPRVSIFSSLPPAGLGVVGHIGNGLLDRFALLLDEPDSIAVLATEPAR